MNSKIETKNLATVAAIAAALNLGVYGVGKLLGASFVVNGGVTMEIPWFLAALATFIPLVLAGLVVQQIAKRFSSFQRFASWAGLAFAFLSIGTVFAASQQVATILALGLMHAIAGVAWFWSTKS